MNREEYYKHDKKDKKDKKKKKKKKKKTRDGFEISVSIGTDSGSGSHYS